MALVDPRDMLNNFCFHVYAQKSMFIGENVNVFWDIHHTRATDIRVHRAGSQLKTDNFCALKSELVVLWPKVLKKRTIYKQTFGPIGP